MVPGVPLRRALAPRSCSPRADAPTLDLGSRTFGVLRPVCGTVLMVPRRASSQVGLRNGSSLVQGANLPGRDSRSACSTRLCSSRPFWTMNCARSPTTLLLGVTCADLLSGVRLDISTWIIG